MTCDKIHDPPVRIRRHLILLTAGRGIEQKLGYGVLYVWCVCLICSWVPLNPVNPLTAGVAYSRIFIFYWHIKYHFLNMFKIKCNINQQDLKRFDLHFVKSE